MQILVLNSGSSSLKYRIYTMAQEAVLAEGLIERIGLDGSRFHYHQGDQVQIREVTIANHRQAVEQVLNGLRLNNIGLQGVGHRVVHGGARYSQAVIINHEVELEIERLAILAPLHNPPCLMGIRTCREALPGLPQVAVFDTAFHQTIPPEAYLYALPWDYYQRHGLRRFGFHGISHQYVAGEAARLLQRPLAELCLITCHLGNGASVAAIQGGRSVDTSMGYTPLAGLPMGTRCGDLDPGVVLDLQQRLGLSPAELSEILNQQSGMLGLSGLSSDFRDLERCAQHDHGRAKLALQVFARSLIRHIGAYAAVMGRVDSVIFTAGLGEHSPAIRATVCNALQLLDIELDQQSNNQGAGARVISTPDSGCQALVIPTNEELLIARETRVLLEA